MARDFVSAKEVANQFGISYRRTLEMLRECVIRSRKENGRWKISPKYLESLKKNNRQRIDRLKAEYIDAYWHGASHYHLQRRVLDDFAEREIIANPDGFAEAAIYESVKKAAAFTPRRNNQKS